MTLWALLLLPLVAVGVAVTLMVSWGSSQGAQAAGGSPQIHMYGNAGACDTTPATGTGNTCTAPVGGNVIVKVQLDKLQGLVDADGDMKTGWTFVQWHGQNNAVIALNDVDGAAVGEAKNCAPGTPAQTGGDGDFGLTCNLASGQNERTDTGNMFQLRYDCVSQGAGVVTQLNGGALDTSLGDENFGGIPANAPDATTLLNITCTPPDRTITINKTDDVTGASIGPSCWQLFVRIVTVSPPSDVNVPLDVVGDNAKVCAGSTGLFPDLNPALGAVTIPVPGAARLQAGSDEWHVLETQAPPKYGIGATAGQKSSCDLENADCVLNLTDPRIAGNINVNFNDTVTGQPLVGQCVDIDATNICDGGVGDNDAANDGHIGSTVALGAHTCAYDNVNQPADRLVKAPTSVACDVSATTPKANVKFNFNPTIPFNLKSPTLANLFLTAQGAKLPPSTCASSTNTAVFTHTISNAPTTADPKDPTQIQQVGGFEMDVLFDEDLICVNLSAGAYFTGTAGSVCFIDDKDQGLQPDGLARIGCVIKGKPLTVSPSLELVRITVRPQPELYSLITADQENGVIVQVLNSGCNLADMQGHPITKIGCDDSELTIRWLEGDVNGDCAVDVMDQQILAFRWGASVGSLLYNDRFDLEPSGQINSDGDIDIKDVQFVYGRHGSTCAVPHPDQPPLNGKVPNP
jgi:hypothetical protein